MNYLNKALKAHQAGNLSEAERLYLLQLQHSPEDPNAKQLLGVVYSSMGKLDRALSLMEQSLLLNPRQPHVANNLALCYKKAGNLDKSFQFFETAINLQADYFEAHKNLISLLITNKKDYRQAELKLDAALLLWPENEKLLEYFASLKKDTQQYNESLLVYKKLVKTNPEKVSYKHNLAVVYRLVGKPKEALAYLLPLYSAGLETFELAHNIANAYSDLGDLHAAVKFYKISIQLNPEYVKSHQNLNDTLWELDEKSSFLNSYLDAFKIVGYTSSSLCFSYVRSLLRISNYDGALKFLYTLPGDYWEQSEYVDLLAQSHYGLGNIEQALITHEKILTLQDTTVSHRLNYIKNLIVNDNIAIATELLREIIDVNPLEQLALAYLDTCMRIASASEEQSLPVYTELVRDYTINIPEGFNSINEFCSKLTEYLESLHTGKQSPLEQTLQGGTQTRGNLFNDDNPLIQSLITQFRACITNYIKQTNYLTTTEFEFSGSWSVRLSDQGFHTSHVHPMGQISSVFYVSLPESMKNGVDKKGWLKFGEPNLKLKSPLPVAHFVKPSVGKLVLFPSYMWHGTVPFDDEGVRMTIAFDIADKFNCV